MTHIRLSLSDADRERLGGPEWLDFDTEDVEIGDMIHVQDVCGLDLLELLDRFPRDPRALKAAVWFGLKRAGVVHDFAALSFKAFGIGHDLNGAGSEGKDPSTPPADTPTS